MGASFAESVEQLRDSWTEYRAVNEYAQRFDFDSQRQLLTRLCGWASEAAATAKESYGEELRLSVSPVELDPTGAPAFRVAINGAFVLTIALSKRHGERTTAWLVARIALPGRDGHPRSVPVGRVRRWTRARLEELVLDLLSAWERDRSASTFTKH